MSKMQTKDATLAKAPANPLEKWKGDLYKEDNLANFGKALLGTGITPERFAWTAYSAAQRNPTLVDPEIPRMALWLGVFSAAECGLSLQPHMQHMHLVPYKGKAPTVTPIVGYQGLAYLVSKASGGLIEPPRIVFQRDVDENRFRYREGTRRMCELDPVVRNPNTPRGMVRYVFATYTNAAGVRTFIVLDRDELLERRERSQGYQAFKKGWRKTSPWNIEVQPDGSEGGDFLAMCRKTAMRDLAKVVPKSADHWGERAAKAEAVEGALDLGSDLSGVLDTTVTIDAEKTGTTRLKERMGLQGEEAAFEAEYTPEEPPPGMAVGERPEDMK